MTPELLIVILTSLGTIILGLFTYLKNTRSATNKLLFIFTLILSAYNVLNFLATHQPTNESTFIFVKLIMSVAALINLAFFLLVSAFPTPTLNIPAIRLWGYIFLTGLIVVLAQINAIFSSVVLTPTGTNSIPGPAMPLFGLHTIGFLGAGFIKLIRKYRLSQGRQKQQFKFLFTGTVIMFAAIILTNFLLVIIFNTTALIQLLPVYTFLFVGFISYAIIRYRFLDITLLVARTVSFSILTIIITSLYASSLFTITHLLPTDQTLPVSIILALILVYTYNPLRRVIENATANIFHKEPYDSSSFLENMGEIVRSTLSLERLAKDSLEEIAHTMQISRAAFIVTQADNPPVIITFDYHVKPNLTDNLIHNLNTAAKDSILVFDDLEESSVKMLLRQEQISIVVPLKVKSTHHGLLILGEKASGEIYSQQDIDVLEILMPQLSVAIQNAKSYEEISRFNITLKEQIALATADLKKANRHLKHLDKLKDDFVFIATHELKNPVTAMRGYLSMLSEGIFGPVPDKMKDPVEQLQASNQQLVDLVNDLLQIARAEAKTITINTQPVKLCEVVDQTVEMVKPLAEQKHLTLSHACPKEGFTVQADENRLKEIVNNLVSNAIKYSDKGAITVSHEVKDKDIITHVTDQGVGIPEKDQAKIFTRFFRVEEEAAKGIPGTGLGLFIVKQLIEKMGGKIWFTSTYGQGTTFSFALPQT